MNKTERDKVKERESGAKLRYDNRERKKRERCPMYLPSPSWAAKPGRPSHRQSEDF